MIFYLSFAATALALMGAAYLFGSNKLFNAAVVMMMVLCGTEVL